MRQQRRLSQEQRCVTAAAAAAESGELHAAATVNDTDE
jgi:hypothetical protein